jgi:ATP-binding cassette, subfamily F, member 3
MDFYFMNEVILRFNKVSFQHTENNPILKEVNFSIRQGTKTTIMGQNGAGKSTLFGLIIKDFYPEEGAISYEDNLSIALSRQVIPREEMKLSVRDFFIKHLGKRYDIDVKIDEVLKIVNLEAKYDKKISSFSGGQQARLLLASALIQNPDLLLLDEPTNNLDQEGIDHLANFLINYPKTCLVISHDADFLNKFTTGVLYLDVFTQKIEQYNGDYFDVQEKIKARQLKENRKNAQLAKQIQENKDKANYFAKKGGRLRLVAKRMREKAAESESNKVDIRREDKTIRPFIIPAQSDMSGLIINISKTKIIKKDKIIEKEVNIELRKNEHLLLKGPNGIGKSTLLESIANNEKSVAKIDPNIKIGYYRQDFSNLNFNDVVYKSLSDSSADPNQQKIRSTASSFLITSDLIKKKIGELSEGQKGLVSFARLVLQEPGLLILDEPTNHINFRHIPIIASALNNYTGAMILVSHISEFVDQIRIDYTLDLNQY